MACHPQHLILLLPCLERSWLADAEIINSTLPNHSWHIQNNNILVLAQPWCTRGPPSWLQGGVWILKYLQSAVAVNDFHNYWMTIIFLLKDWPCVHYINQGMRPPVSAVFTVSTLGTVAINLTNRSHRGPRKLHCLGCYQSYSVNYDFYPGAISFSEIPGHPQDPIHSCLYTVYLIKRSVNILATKIRIIGDM